MPVKFGGIVAEDLEFIIISRIREHHRTVRM